MASLLGTTPDLSLVKDLVSENWALKLVANASGADKSPIDDFGKGPIRESFEINPNFSKNTKETEKGRKSTTSTTQEWELKVVTGQISLATMYGIPNVMLGQYVLIVLELNEDPIGGKHFYAACLCLYNALPPLKNKGSVEYVFEIVPVTDDVDVELNETDFPHFKGDLSTPITLTIASGTYMGMVEASAA